MLRTSLLLLRSFGATFSTNSFLPSHQLCCTTPHPSPPVVRNLFDDARVWMESEAIFQSPVNLSFTPAELASQLVNGSASSKPGAYESERRVEEIYGIDEKNLQLSLEEFQDRLNESLTDWEVFYRGEISPTVPLNEGAFDSAVEKADEALRETGIVPAHGLHVPFVALVCYCIGADSPVLLHKAINDALEGVYLHGNYRAYDRFKFVIDLILYGLLQLPLVHFSEHQDSALFFRGDKKTHFELWEEYLPVDGVPRPLPHFCSTSDRIQTALEYLVKHPVDSEPFVLTSVLDPQFESEDAGYRVLYEIFAEGNPDEDASAGFCREVSSFSPFPNESETLFLPGTEFIVEDVSLMTVGETTEETTQNGLIRLQLRFSECLEAIALPKEFEL